MKNTLKTTALTLALTIGSVFATAPKAQGQIGVNIAIGQPIYNAPVCQYGYFDYYPYSCSPYGYYNGDWFVNGLFIGAGPWYHYGHRGPGFRNGWYNGYRGGPGFHDGRYYGDSRSSEFRNHPEYRGEYNPQFHGNEQHERQQQQHNNEQHERQHGDEQHRGGHR